MKLLISIVCLSSVFYIQIIHPMRASSNELALLQNEKKNIAQCKQEMIRTKENLEKKVNELGSLCKNYYFLLERSVRLKNPSKQKELSAQEEADSNLAAVILEVWCTWCRDYLHIALREPTKALDVGYRGATTIFQELLHKNKYYGVQFLLQDMKQDPNRQAGYSVVHFYDLPPLFIPHSPAIAALLIKHGANINVKLFGRTPLIYQFMYEKDHSPELLAYYLTLSNFNYADRSDFSEDTVLHKVAAIKSYKASYLKKLEMLLGLEKLDVNSLNKYNKTALDIICNNRQLPENDKDRIIALFESAGAKTAKQLRDASNIIMN